ncbi:ABC transporter permease [Novipirellula artificiosorum]|uniref:Inner membrane transport permease YbhR n=1 Tax=Novipirellula artificiosorum TaxID=2528016 RepID=A0A5C6D2C7_9BACT|nr:ABC transporter permease [Novipirellula artificiosorum]TWU31343.1 Inner membrane transport permease YbhR [Novipirellula artificiosorum]
MRCIWVIASNDLRVFLKDKGGYFWLFVMPVVFIYFFGTATGGSDRPPEDPRPTVVVHNEDSGYVGAIFLEQLEQEGFRVIDWVDADPAERTLHIPEDFTAKVESAEQVDVEFFRRSDSDLQPAAMVEVRIVRAITAVTSAIFAVVSQEADSMLREAPLRAMLAREKPVQLEVQFAGRRKIPSGFEQSVPGYLVMFVLMNLLIFGGLAISQERSGGVLRRIAVHPVSRMQLVVGKILGRFLLGIVQIVYLLLISKLVFGMDYGDNLLLIGVTLVVFAWGCASLGVLIAAVVKNQESVQGLCTLGSIAMAALGGCWWPLEIVPDFARQVGQLFPTAWAMDAMHQLISFGGGLAEILNPLGLIALFAITTSLLAAKSLRFQ